MKKTLVLSITVFAFATGSVFADIFAEGTANEFNIDFVPISGDASSANGTNISQFSSGEAGYRTFTDPGSDYRMGTYEITNDQFAKFAPNINVYWTGDDVPATRISWFEAAQFVNYLNASTGNPAAYKFSGSTFTVWDVTDTGYDASNPFRNSNAKYFMPTEDEWVKAAYWNGTNLQTHATKDGESLNQGDGVSGTGWNYWDDDYATDPYGPWNVGSGSEELNGTFDMMGNVWEWMESPYYSGNTPSSSDRGLRGGSYNDSGLYLRSSYRHYFNPNDEIDVIGFRVASVPEPASLVLLSLGGLALRCRKR